MAYLVLTARHVALVLFSCSSAPFMFILFLFCTKYYILILCNATQRSTSHCITCINICQTLIQFEIFSGDEVNKPMAAVQILLLLYPIYNMYITCMLLK